MKVTTQTKSEKRAALNSVVGAAGIVAADEEFQSSETTQHSSAHIYELDPTCDSRWEDLANSHPKAAVFHSTKWLKALQTVYGYEPIAITTCPPGTRLTNGLVLCRVRSWVTGRRYVSVPFSDHCEPLVDRSDELDEMLLHMKRYVDKDGLKYIEIRPVSCEPSIHTEFGRLVTYSFHRLDLSVSSEKLFRNFHKDCVQRKIRRAEREKLQYEEGASEDLLQKFYRLLVMTRRRQFLPPQPRSWFRGLIAVFGNDLKIRVASKNGVPVASILTLSHKKSMIYKYGCSNAAFNNLGGTALLFWKTIQEAKDGGLESLDMGRSDVDNRGLIAFKEHWGANATSISYWTYPERPERHSTGWKKRLAEQLVSAAPDLALETVGRLLYRHIG
ncbi:MAG TPA: GNAT family N-acetyltransferase [Terriglobales bacterium]|nr:GNAT family N-acetyltransferase [Terriglobales bacterium]